MNNNDSNFEIKSKCNNTSNKFLLYFLCLILGIGIGFGCCHIMKTNTVENNSENVINNEQSSGKESEIEYDNNELNVNDSINEVIPDNKVDDNKFDMISEQKKAYLNVIDSLEDKENLKYNLVYIDDDDIYELLIDTTGYYLELYSYNDGNIVDLIENEYYLGYGTHGRQYEYAEKKNILKCMAYDNSEDNAVTWATEFYSIINDKIDLLGYYTLKSCINAEGVFDECSGDDKDPKYSGSIDFDKLNSYTYDFLSGKYSYDEIVDLLSY